MPIAAHPFQIHIPDEVLADLQHRLARTRWPEEVQGADWNYGTNLTYLNELVAYWQDGFHWRERERMLNQFQHYQADIDGQKIHFVHERGKGPNPTPLLINHGWPFSFVEILNVVPLLTDPERFGGRADESFDVVVPSLPGFGFSGRPTQPGQMTIPRMADLFDTLMTEVLGYARYGAQGGDYGGGIVKQLGLQHPQHLIGLHLTDVNYPYNQRQSKDLSPAEQQFEQAVMSWSMTEGGYAMIQGTKPQTLAYGLTDSPAGLAGWLLEKFRSWSDCNGEVETRFTKDELLTTMTLYWVTNTIGSSVRMYFEENMAPNQPQYEQKSEVPTAVALFPKDIIGQPPREWAERAYNVVRWTPMQHGGHFPAHEEPEALAQDLRAFFGSINR